MSNIDSSCHILIIYQNVNGWGWYICYMFTFLLKTDTRQMKLRFQFCGLLSSSSSQLIFICRSDGGGAPSVMDGDIKRCDFCFFFIIDIQFLYKVITSKCLIVQNIVLGYTKFVSIKLCWFFGVSTQKGVWWNIHISFEWNLLKGRLCK